MEKIIKLISINKKITKYLISFKVNSLEELTLEQGNQFFIQIIKDFKIGKITLDELSVFGHNIFHNIGKKHIKSDLFKASLSASELNFCIRTPKVFDNITIFLSDIEKFFEKYNSKK